MLFHSSQVFFLLIYIDLQVFDRIISASDFLDASGKGVFFQILKSKKKAYIFNSL